jgi:DNA-directed RNA polymerase specialized sigma24 family protein
VKSDSDPPGVFATTQWSVVLAASRPDAPGHDAALERLCRTYWYPVYAFVRRRGAAPADAEDLTQEFFARLLAKEWLAGVVENGSRFRSFLLTAVACFLANEHDRRTAAKRGGGVKPLDLDEAEGRYLADVPGGESAERSYDRHWALTVMDTAMRQLREEARAGGRDVIFERLSPYLSREPAPGEYEALAPELRTNPGAVAVAVFRLRRRYRELVRSLVAETVAHPSDVDAEFRHLIDVLRV